METSINHITDIKAVIARFANAFDLKDWQTLADVLADTIQCDYQDLRKELKLCTREEYVALREASLKSLHTHHVFANYDVQLLSEVAHCQVSALILRQDHRGIPFNTHAIYKFTLVPLEQTWRINKIKQTVLWNEGDASIHSGVTTKQ